MEAPSLNSVCAAPTAKTPHPGTQAPANCLAALAASARYPPPNPSQVVYMPTAGQRSGYLNLTSPEPPMGVRTEPETAKDDRNGSTVRLPVWDWSRLVDRAGILDSGTSRTVKGDEQMNLMAHKKNLAVI